MSFPDKSPLALTKKAPNQIDVHVGARVRMRRMLLSMSQGKLAAALGLTFQQVQKYEKGNNRIGASRLQQIAGILDVPVSFFFENAPGAFLAAGAGQTAADQQAMTIQAALSTSDGLALAKAFSRIRDGKLRRSIVDLVKCIASGEGELQEAA